MTILNEPQHIEHFEVEQLVKSSQRVRDLGEVFTPASIVDDMLNLLPMDIWQIHPSKTFLEPSVGSGNFVSAVLSRKLAQVDMAIENNSLPAGSSYQAAEFHALEALSSIYGVDISEDNIIGGSLGHENACRPRLMGIMAQWLTEKNDANHKESASFQATAQWIVDHNMIIGNMLDFDSAGIPIDKSLLKLIEYSWEPRDLSVTLKFTDLGTLIQTELEDSQGLSTLFGPEPPAFLWSGKYEEIPDVPSFARTQLAGESATNGRDRQ